MKTLYSIIATLLISGFAFSQQVEIVSEEDALNYAGQTITISGDDNELSKVFYVKNTGTTTKFFWSRTIISKSSPGFLIQLCDENICYNTTGLYWIGPEKTIIPGDSLLFKPQMTPMFVAGTAEVKYFVLDENEVKIDSLIVKFTSTLSTNKEEKLEFSIFPNPVQDVVTLKGDAIKNGGTVVFLDALGKEVKRASVSTTNNQINVSTLRRGVYFVNIYNQSGTKSTVQRLIKQ